MSKKDDNTAALLEDMNGKFDFLIEITAAMKEKVDRIPFMELRLDSVETNIKVIKAALIKTNQNAIAHSTRLQHLETKHHD